MQQYNLGYAFEHRFSPVLSLRHSVRFEKEWGEGNFVGMSAMKPNQRLQPRTARRQAIDDYILAADTSVLSQFESAGLKHRVVAGFDMRRSRSSLFSYICSVAPLDLFDPRYAASVPCSRTPETHTPATITSAGLYLQDQIRFSPQWLALVGMRYEKYRNDAHDLVRGRRSLDSGGALTGSAGLLWNFRPEWSAYASFSNSFLPVAGQTFAGEVFKPESGRQYELGMKYVKGPWVGSAALFDLTRRNAQTSDPLNVGYQVQVGAQRARGMELELGADMGHGWKLSSAYAYTQLPAYAVADASVGYDGDFWRITASVRNLFDRRYYDGAINANVVSPGMPRTFMVQARLDY